MVSLLLLFVLLKTIFEEKRFWDHFIEQFANFCTSGHLFNLHCADSRSAKTLNEKFYLFWAAPIVKHEVGTVANFSHVQ